MHGLLSLAHIDWAFWAAILSGYAIPGFTAYITKAGWDGAVKGIITNLLAFVAAFAATLAATPDGHDYDYKAALLAGLATAFVAKHARVNIYQRTKLDAHLQSRGIH